MPEINTDNYFAFSEYNKHPTETGFQKPTKSLWNMSTTVREAERVRGFLKVASLMDGEAWDTDGQKRFQYLLVQKKQYLNDPGNTQNFGKLNSEQIEALCSTEEMSYEMAASIIEAKKYVGGSEMRGRQSMAPLRKLGLVYVDELKKIHITDLGLKLINNQITDEEFFLESLLKLQYPNPLDTSYPNINIKPFIGMLILIKKVNEECARHGIEPKGITRDEFGIFALSLDDHRFIDQTVRCLLVFRKKMKSLASDEEREAFKEDYISTYLRDFKGASNNVREYSDNMIRYFRQTKLIYIRGKYSHVYIDLEPRRSTEINAILAKDDASPKIFANEREYIEYFGTFGTYELPYETLSTLKTILANVYNENRTLSAELEVNISQISLNLEDKQQLKKAIEEQRRLRTKLQNLKLKRDYFDSSKIDEAIEVLNKILTHDNSLTNRPSLELEKWANIALNIFNDALIIKPNTYVGDDNEPINTAPAGVPDIECFYSAFDSICEVTTLTGRDQWYNEGQPVMRHLRDFENKSKKPCYCMFIAPKIHQDTMNTFWNSVKYEYQGTKQLIVPLTIRQLITMLETVKAIHKKGNRLTSTQLRSLMDDCCNLNAVSSSDQWLERISEKIQTWRPAA